MPRLIVLPLSMLLSLCCIAVAQGPASVSQVTVSEGTIEIPTYEHIGRELEPPLFENSSVLGLYPFPTYLAPFREGDPKTQKYQTVMVENEYLKLTYIPEFGGRFFSLYDKLRKKEVFYRNDVIKPTMFNPRLNWPQSGIELTGPYDVHMLTLHGEPYWSHTIDRHSDGSVSLVLGEMDPIYHAKVNLTATLYPGIAAMQISVFCYNGNDARIPQMFWTNASFPSTEKTRYIYPMTRTIGHTTGEVSDWPLYNGVDYSWDRNNKHMLGVFGIDSYDNFAGSYQFDRDYGVFRYADRRVVQGMKMWTFGYGPGAEQVQQGYTDHAGPYVEVQSGRHVWDGHYEWIAPHKAESWSEWWVPVAGISGLTTMTRDVALDLTVEGENGGKESAVKVALSPSRKLSNARLIVASKQGEIANTQIELNPGTPFLKTISGIHTPPDSLAGLTVRIMNSTGNPVMDYQRPDENPGRKEYSPFAKALEKPQTAPDQMSAEELVEAAEFKLKESNPSGMLELVAKAQKIDPEYSQAHILLGTYYYTVGQYKQAAEEMSKATERDPYSGEAWYYLAVSQLALGNTLSAERNFYFIAPESAYFGAREYQLGKLSILSNTYNEAADHFKRAVMANGYDLNARGLLVLAYLLQKNTENASQALDELTKVDPTNRIVAAERYFLARDEKSKQDLVNLLGDQSQEAIDLAIFFESVHRWPQAVEILQLVSGKNQDPWGTSSLFYYTLAYDLEKSGDAAAAREYLRKAQAAKDVVDRFPYRPESEAALMQAIQANPKDAVARLDLGYLLYSLHRPDEAVAQWQQVNEINPGCFSARRALGLAYAEQGKIDEAAGELEKAIEFKPDHLRTLNDLSSIYARAARFDDQIALLHKALKRSPEDDDLFMALLDAYLMKGQYQDADAIVKTHQFAPRHRSTVLRDEYRSLRYAMGSVAFNRGQYAQALAAFESALKPPVSLGVDDFQFESTPRAYYYIGRTLEALGRAEEAKAAYQESTRGVDLLSGDRDSWNSDNFYAVLSLERLGQKDRANGLIPHFEGFARTEMDETNMVHRGQARYLLALIAKHAGQPEKARELIKDSLQALPDFLAPRYELRGDVIDPITDRATAAK